MTVIAPEVQLHLEVGAPFGKFKVKLTTVDPGLFQLRPPSSTMLTPVLHGGPAANPSVQFQFVNGNVGGGPDNVVVVVDGIVVGDGIVVVVGVKTMQPA